MILALVIVGTVAGLSIHFKEPIATEPPATEPPATEPPATEPPESEWWTVPDTIAPTARNAF